MMKTHEHDAHMRKNMHELLSHYDRKSVHQKIHGPHFQVKSIKQLEKDLM